MKTLHSPTTLLRRSLVLVAYLVAIIAGLKYGFDFGKHISGTALGIVLAINSAVFCSFVVGMAVDRAFPQKATEPEQP